MGKTSKKVVAASGYFDPIHIGHLEYLKRAKELGDKLVVIVNNTNQAQLKKGHEFMPLSERLAVVEALGCVDEVMESVDHDPTVCESLRSLKPDIFAKGGDRLKGEIPESDICRELGIEIVDGLGEKIQSSSTLVEQAREKPDAQGTS